MVKPDENPIEDSLLAACSEFLHITAMTGNTEGNTALQDRFAALMNIWIGRYNRSNDPFFPCITDYVPLAQWTETTSTYKDQVIQFVGDLAEYLLNVKKLGGA